MKTIEKEISKEVYDRAMLIHGHIAGDDYKIVFSPQEYMGYGVYNDRVVSSNGKYYVKYQIGDSCD